MEEVLGVHEGDDAVQGHARFELFVGPECGGHRSWIRHAGGFHHDALELRIGLEEHLQRLHEVPFDAAADATVPQLDPPLDGGSGPDGPFAHDVFFHAQFLSDFVDQYRHVLSSRTGEQVVQEGCLSCTQESRHQGHRHRTLPRGPCLGFDRFVRVLRLVPFVRTPSFRSRSFPSFSSSFGGVQRHGLRGSILVPFFCVHRLDRCMDRHVGKGSPPLEPWVEGGCSLLHPPPSSSPLPVPSRPVLPWEWGNGGNEWRE
eukprot:scaffold1800_cov332-Pavlova_lutheri.AAC.20